MLESLLQLSAKVGRLDPEFVLRHSGNDTIKRYACASGIIGDYLYIFGGIRGTTLLGDMHRYDLKTNTWEQLYPENSPPARAACASVVANGKLYMINGRNSAGTTASGFREVQVYDPVTNRWDLLTTTPTGLGISYPAATYHDGRIHVFGGYTSYTLTYSGYLDLTTLTWSSFGSPIGRHGTQLVESNGTLTLHTGVPENNSLGIYQRAADPAGPNWVMKRADGKLRSYTAHAVREGKLYGYGGYTGNGSTAGSQYSDFYELDLTTFAFRYFDNPITERHAALGHLYGDSMILFGGHRYALGGQTGELWEIKLPTKFDGVN